MKQDVIQPWIILGSTYSFRDEWVKLRSDDVLLPNGATLLPFHTVELPDGVNVVALTEGDETILIEQYRHAVGRTLVELPAGHIGTSEDPETAARRELKEETGFGGGAWYYLGPTFIMASRLSNRAHNFLALGVSLEGEPSPDAAEIIQTYRVPWKMLLSSMGSGAPLVSEANQIAALLMASQFVAGRSDLHTLGVR